MPVRAKPDLESVDFNERPFTLAWELTRSCALACRHCRAAAQPRRHPDELTTAEALRLVDVIADWQPPVLVLTGGDPMMRPDLFEIVERAVARNLRVAVSPTTTALTTRARLERLRDMGVSMIHVSLDGATPATHDAFRGVSGAFARAQQILTDLHDLGMPVQVGSTMTRQNVHELPALAQIMVARGVRVWNVFYLVPTGRGRLDDMLTAEAAEASWQWLADLSQTAPFTVRTTAAPQFRRTMVLRARAGAGDVRLTGAGYRFLESAGGVMSRGVNDGKGFCFVDHLGNVCPSGFLQVSGGNVREAPLAEIYQSSPLFRELRDPSALTGRCGVCPFAELCGGSRARAYGVTGSYLADDPLCTFRFEDAAPLGAAAAAREA